MRIGLIADTHIPGRARSLPEAVLSAFRGADLILHAGDIVSRTVLDALERLAPVIAVAGNNDPPELVSALGLTREVWAGGCRIGLTHGHFGRGRSTVERALSHFPGADCVVFGHSHMPYVRLLGRTLAFNPGSATDRRRAPSCSIGFLLIDPSGLRTEHQAI